MGAASTLQQPPVLQQDDAYVAIRAQDFLSGSKSLFDVFVRLESGHYIKLLVAGDSFTRERIDNYISKGVTHFYILKEAHEQYIKYCSTLSTAVVRKKGLSDEIKLAQTMNHGEEVMSYLRNQGVRPELIGYARGFVDNVRELVQQLDPGAHELVKGFMSDVASYEHGVGTSMLAGILAHVIEIRMEKTVQIVGLAALMHDVGLSELPENLRDEDETRMSEGERKRYRSHPALGADILSSLGGVDEGAIQAVEQHHMRLHGYMGGGFPERPENAQITRVAEIIGICDEFNHCLRQVRDRTDFNVLMDLERRIFPGFSRQVVYAFRSAFFPKR